MRQITASEVKPGMEVQFDLEGWDVKGTVGAVKVLPRSVWIYTEKCRVMSLGLDSPVTVLAEPQPEEPTEFGARAVMDGQKFLRSPEGKFDSRPWLEENKGTWRDWDDLCAMGPVQVVPDQGWTVPDDTPEVPDRIKEWPENDEHLRAYKWMDFDECVWWYGGDGEWRFVTRSGIPSYPHPCPCDGPWTRVPDDTPEVPERIKEWPEDDTALRPYKWQDEYGEIWRHGRNSHVEGWTSGYLFQNRPVYGPWDRVTDA